MRKGLTVLAVVSVLCCAPVAHAQDMLGARLQADAIGNVHAGAYLAGDSLKFLLDKYGNKFLLRIAGDPEIYVLYSDRASLGGRVLKYDSGAVVINVAGWGGMTIYTDPHPEGLPAVRTGDSTAPVLQPVTQSEGQNAANDEEQHLTYAYKTTIAVTVDWAGARDPIERAQTFDAMQNTVRGLDRFSHSQQGRSALGKIDTVSITTTTSVKPTATINGKTLIVTYNKGQGFAGRASSRGIARALGLLFKVKVAN